jgi:hypothetical protein
MSMGPKVRAQPNTVKDVLTRIIQSKPNDAQPCRMRNNRQ